MIATVIFYIHTGGEFPLCPTTTASSISVSQHEALSERLGPDFVDAMLAVKWKAKGTKGILYVVRSLDYLGETTNYLHATLCWWRCIWLRVTCYMWVEDKSGAVEYMENSNMWLLANRRNIKYWLTLQRCVDRLL